MTVKVTVLGASGYIGGEVVRLLLGHPHVEIVSICANEHADKRLDEIQPNLRGYSDLVFVKDPAPAEATFLALPHEESMRIVPKLQGKVLDLSGAFRLASREVFETYYKMAHVAWELRKDFVYGVPELHRGQIKEARKVAVGGCFATASILSLRPLRDLADGQAIVDGKTGSSGSGNKPGEKTHHPFRAGSFFAYEAFRHRHTPEIEQESGLQVLFQPHSAPMVRGVFTTSYVPLRNPMTDDEILAHYRKFYHGEKFVRTGKGTPNVRNVAGSNFVDIGVAAQGKQAVVWAAIDNLIKGGAGQAVQCFNLMFGFEEGTALMQAPANP
jgi:N-acetyl-gamma-glutamyl-phosphate reductase common form